MIEKTTIDQVNDRVEIADVVEKMGLSLKKRGSSLIACCPFHSERTPSFTVNPVRNTYHCFGCGKHGDAIGFVMDFDNKTYPEAIEYIANLYGIPVLHNERQQTDEEKSLSQQFETTVLAVGKVQEFFVEQLAADTSEAQKAREYAYSRWGEKYCKEIGVGYAPSDWDALPDWCKNKFADLQALQDAGILRFSEKSRKLYSIFRERVTIPITNRYGVVIGFTARYIGDDPTQPKYINSSDSLIFKKGETVFGFKNALRAAVKACRFIIVEGAPDALKLQSDEVGLHETVASLGTAWTKEQFKLLQRYAPSLVFLPDADVPKGGEKLGPGVKAVLKNGLTAFNMGFTVSVREIPFKKIPEVVPCTDEEIEEAILEARKKKYESAYKVYEKELAKFQRNQTRKNPKEMDEPVIPTLDEIQLTEKELAQIPKEKTEFQLEKNDPDSFIFSMDDFNKLEDEHFAVWYGRTLLSICDSDTERVETLKDVCKNILASIEDKTLIADILGKLSAIFGNLKLWRDALQHAKMQLWRETEERKKKEMDSDEALMKDLGFFIQNGGYCTYNKDGELERWSNFTMEPLFHIIDGEDAIRIFRIKNERGTIKEIEFRQEELISLSRFMQRIESQGFFNFKGDNIRLQNLKEYMYSKTISAILLPKMGWNDTEYLYVFGDGIFSDNVLYEANDLGIVTIGDRIFYLPAFAKMHSEEKDAYQFERSFSCKVHGEISLYDYIKKMVTVFGDNAKVGFAFVLATLFLDIVKESSKRLALLNIFGRKGTGKTELGTALMSFFIRQNDPPSLATTSMASLNEMLSSAENNLVHLDEYKNELDFRKIEILKQIWGGSGQTKKNMDGDKKVKRTFVRSGVILTGQDAPTRDDALFSRVIHLSYSETTFSKEAKRNFEEFQTISSRGVSHLTVQLLKLRKLFEADYAHHYAVCKRELIAALSEDVIEDRLLNNWLAPLAAFHTVQTSLELPFTYTDLFNICVGGIRRQNELLKKNSDIAVFWNLLDSNHMQGRIIAKAHFVLKRQENFKRSENQIIDFGRQKTLLYLNFQNVVTALGQRVNGSNIIGKLDTVSLDSYLRTHPAFLGTKQCRFRVLTPNGTPDYVTETRNGVFVRKLKEVRPMAFVFDYELLKESYDLNLEILERAENELEDDEPDKPIEPVTPSPEPPKPLSIFPDEDDDTEAPY